MPSQQSHERPLADLIAELEERGITGRKEQAEALGMTYPTYMRKRGHAGLAEKPDYSMWIPWTVATEHHQTTIYQRLHRLAQAAAGRSTAYRGRRMQALRWAQKLIRQDLDVDYSREEGWSYVAAIPEHWALKRVYDGAVRYLVSLEQLDDLRELGELEDL